MVVQKSRMDLEQVMEKIVRSMFIISVVLFAILIGIIIYQVARALLGGTWPLENIMLGAVSLNLTMTMGLFGIMYAMNGALSRHLGHHAASDQWNKKHIAGTERRLFALERTIFR